MKISKVNHARMGVSAEPIEAGGMMYAYPKKGKAFQDIRERIKNLNKKAMGLYSLFVEPESKQQTALKATVRKLNDYYREYIKDKVVENADAESIYSNMISSVPSYKTYQYEDKDRKRKNLIVNDYLVNNAIDRCLRQSLRKSINVDGTKIYIPDFLKKFSLLVANEEGSYGEDIICVDKSELMAVIEFIRMDMTKEDRIEVLATSIEQQNVPVQVSKDGKHIILSSAYNEKKAYIFEFLKEYAAASKDEQNKLLEHMRELIVLYVMGSQVAEGCSGSLNSMAVLKSMDGCEGYISDELFDLVETKANLTNKDKAEIRKTKDLIKKEISNITLDRYNEAINSNLISGNDSYWIGYISDQVSKLLNKSSLSSTKLGKCYICEQIWKTWTSYIALKYIDMGKGAYHFALNNLEDVVSGNETELGIIDSNYKEGISSFDYEKTSADDSLNRSMSQFLAFAINNFDFAARTEANRLVTNDKGESINADILSTKKIEYNTDAKRQILRYFGGQSMYEDTPVENVTGADLAGDIIKYLRVSRNSSFHYVSGDSKGFESTIIRDIFNKEMASAGSIYRKKYFSNNIPFFYSISDIDKTMDYLYASMRKDPAQVPSFNKIFSKKHFKTVVNDLIPVKNRVGISDPEKADKLEAALYFMFKEIYYNDFLKQNDLNKRFLRALNNEKPKDKNEQSAHDDFKRRVDVLTNTDLTFGEFCQEIMTEFNQQNDDKKKQASAFKSSANDKIVEKENTQIYKHYRDLLYLGIKGAFISFVKEREMYSFIKKPSYKVDRTTEEAFVSSWQTPMYEHLSVGKADNEWLSSWYVTAHFLNQRQLNLLIGQIKTYIQYINSIESRAYATGGKVAYKSADVTDGYLKLLAILDFVKLYCGSVSNTLTDYFEDENAYAKYVAKYVDFDGDTKDALMNFCNEKIETKNGFETIKHFYDGMNPILDRNLVQASMYGCDVVLTKVIDKLQKKTLRDYYKRKEEIVKILASGTKNKDEINKVRSFQNLSNRVNLVDISIFSELISNIQGQFIGMAYLRERDLMYMQLGFYYTKLFYTDSIPSDHYLRTLEGDCSIKDGAVLYQIASMYSYSLPIYERDDAGKAIALNEGEIGKKVKQFAVKYCKDSNYETYTNGLYFFEDVDGRHDEYVDLRRYIEHFKYYANQEKSILDIYSDIYGGFFSYNTKLKKSISYTLPNLLLSNFVVANLGFDYKDETVKNKTVRRTNIVIKSLASDYLTYKELTPTMLSEMEEKGAVKAETAEDAPLDIAGLMATLNGSFSSKNSKPNNKSSKQESNGGAKNEVGQKGLKVLARDAAFINTVSRLLSYKAEK